MNDLDLIRLHVDTLYSAIHQDERFFSSITNYVKKLKEILYIEKIQPTTNKDIYIIAYEIEAFFKRFRPSPKSTTFYMPPAGASNNDATVEKIYELALKLKEMDEKNFSLLWNEANNSSSNSDIHKDMNKEQNGLSIIELICSRFHLVVNRMRLRYDNRDTLDVKDEYDVQNLLHALMEIHFDDIRPEEWTPSYAGRSSIMDFLLKEHNLVIETKMTRKGLDAKVLGKQLIEDIARYHKHPDCKILVCFVYDPEGKITNPHGIENDLSRRESNLVVKVIIRPKGY